MGRLIFILLFGIRIFATGLIGQTTGDLRYFLSETDVLSNHSVPRIEVKGKAHLEGRFDSNIHVIELKSLNSDMTTKWEKGFNYDEKGNLEQRREWDGQGNLVSEMTMGIDKDAKNFVHYLYGVDQVLSWGDRFTIRRFNRRNYPYQKTFYEADGNPYGQVEEISDSLGRIKYKVWTRLPEGEVIRRWEYRYGPKGGYSLQQFDRSGAVVERKIYNPAGQRVIITFIQPDTNRRLHNLTIHYNLSDSLKAGSISLIQSNTGKLKDYTLENEELLPGEHEIVLDEKPFVSESAEYSLVFSGNSMREGVVQNDTLQHIRFDITPPELTIGADTVLTIPKIRFSTTEPLKEGTLVWIPDSTTVLSTSPRLIPLTSTELKFSDSLAFSPKFASNLDEEGIYRVVMLARDLAGNLGKSPAIPRVRYDPNPPEIGIESPESQSISNDSIVSFTNDEKLSELTVWLSTSIGRFSFGLTNQLKPGKESWAFPDAFLKPDVNISQLSLVAKDLAGNVSDSAIVQNLRFDFTQPHLTLIYPASGTHISDGSMSVVANESIMDFDVRWHKDDQPDSTDLVFTITGNANTAGDKINLHPPIEDSLQVNQIYSLTISCRDSAGNRSNRITSDSLRYDPDPPEFIILKPEYGERQRPFKLVFEANETLEKGGMYLSQTKRGKTDTIAFSFPDSLLKAGEHTFSPGAVRELGLKGEFSLWVTGEDLAGNMSEISRVNRFYIIPAE